MLIQKGLLRYNYGLAGMAIPSDQSMTKIISSYYKCGKDIPQVLIPSTLPLFLSFRRSVFESVEYVVLE